MMSPLRVNRTMFGTPPNFPKISGEIRGKYLYPDPIIPSLYSLNSGYGQKRERIIS